MLSVTAESTAWATQLRLIQSQVLAKIAAEVGDGVVTSLKITGPTAPSWRKGPRHISGRGPRDTYGMSLPRAIRSGPSEARKRPRQGVRTQAERKIPHTAQIAV